MSIFTNYEYMDYRKKSEEELSVELLRIRKELDETRHIAGLFLSNGREAVFELDEQALIRYISPAILNLTGSTPEELTGFNLLKFLDPGNTLTLTEIFTLSPSDHSVDKEYHIETNSGEKRWVRFSMKPVIVRGAITGATGTISDISSRKELEGALAGSELKYRSFFDSNALPMIYMDPLGGAILDANPAACSFYGWTLEELCRMNIDEINTLSKDEIRRVGLSVSKGDSKYFITRHRLSNGDTRDVEVYPSPVKIGERIVNHAIINDITERKRVQENIAINELRHRLVALHSRTVIWEIDMDGLYTYVSDVANEVYGYSPESLIGKKYFFDLHPVELREEFRKKGLDYILSGKEIINFDNPVETSNGRLLWVSTNGEPIFRDKVLIGYRGSDIDINSRKIAEEEIRKFRTVMDQAKLWSCYYRYFRIDCIHQ